MFNAPRPTQAYGISSSFGGNFVDENPLAASTYDGLDPWSAAPTPSPPPGRVPSIFTNAVGTYFFSKKKSSCGLSCDADRL
jgi:sorting nexin-8